MACLSSTIAASTDLGSGAVLTVVGMLVVFATLSVLGLLIVLLNRWLKVVRPPVDPAKTTGAAGLDPRLIAVLTAAATVAALQQVRLRKIKLVEGGDRGGSA